MELTSLQEKNARSSTQERTVGIGRLDLNLLKVFDAVFEDRNLVLAGRRLNLSQSAVSHALTRLRALVGDDLFLRTGKGMVPTARATDWRPRCATPCAASMPRWAWSLSRRRSRRAASSSRPMTTSPPSSLRRCRASCGTLRPASTW